MPIYQAKCNKCEHEEEVFRHVSEYDDMPMHCGQMMERQISGAMVVPDQAPYKSMIDGSVINSRSKHRAHLKQHGCIEVGNETKYLKPRATTPPAGLKDAIINAVNQHTRS